MRLDGVIRMGIDQIGRTWTSTSARLFVGAGKPLSVERATLGTTAESDSVAKLVEVSGRGRAFPARLLARHMTTHLRTKLSTPGSSTPGEHQPRTSKRGPRLIMHVIPQ